MDLYTFSLALGGVGLGVMALGGLGHQGGAHGHGGHGHAGPGHAGHAGHGGHGVAHVHPHAHGGEHGHAPTHAQPHAHEAGGATQGVGATALLWTLATPRVVFSVLLGFGATGVLLRAWFGGVVLAAIALVVGVAFERLAIRPLINGLLSFASTPARTLESTLLDEAHAASGFDANGEGLVAIDVDGQIVQVLGTLRPEDRQLGVRVRAGDRLRIEDVDGERHRCTVSFLGRP
jgi:hypothetical protein